MWPQADLPLVSHIRWVSIVLWKCRSYPFAVLPLWWGKLCLPVWEVRSRAAFKTIKIFSKSRSACHLCDNRNQMVAPKDMVSIDWLYLYIWGISFFSSKCQNTLLKYLLWFCLKSKKTYDQKCRDKEEADQNVNRNTNTNNTKHMEKVLWQQQSPALISI